MFPGKSRDNRGREDSSGAAPRDDPKSFRWRANFVLGAAGVRRARSGLARRRAAAQGSQVPRGAGRCAFHRASPRSPRIAATSPTATASRSRCRTPVDSVWANPKELALASDQLPRLAKALKRDKTRARAPRSPATSTASSSISRATCSRARRRRSAQLEIPGVYLMREYRRYYPAGEVAGHVLGFTNVDDEGQEGLELAFDHWLAGEDGAKRVIQDRYGKIVQNVEEHPRDAAGPQPRAVDRPAHPVPRVSRTEGGDPRPAREVRLGDRARRRDRRSAGDGQPARLQPERPRADQRQGRIAIARSPTSSSRARAIKPFVVAAGLASGRFTDHSIIDTNPGYIKVGAKLLEDPHNLGAIGLATILAKSSNVGMTKVALALEPAQMYGHADRSSASARSRPSGYPGESAGLLPHYSHWRPVGISSMSRGYGLSVTPLQLAHAYATVACVRHRAPGLVPARRRRRRPASACSTPASRAR